jgi:hypothetical protein
MVYEVQEATTAFFNDFVAIMEQKMFWEKQKIKNAY